MGLKVMFGVLVLVMMSSVVLADNGLGFNDPCYVPADTPLGVTVYFDNNTQLYYDLGVKNICTGTSLLWQDPMNLTVFGD